MQAFRLGANVYATQFHPELDAVGISTRVDVYRHYGYFEPEDADRIKEMARQATVTEPERILKAFVERYA